MTKEYTYSDELYSDLYKEVYGVRPRSDYDQWLKMDPHEKQEEWDHLLVCLDINADKEKAAGERAVEIFIDGLNSQCPSCHTTEEQVIQITQHEDFNNTQDIEHWVWGHGLLFTNYGRNILTILTNHYFK